MVATVLFVDNAGLVMSCHEKNTQEDRVPTDLKVGTDPENPGTVGSRFEHQDL